MVQWLAAAFMHDVILLEVQAGVIGGYRSYAVASADGIAHPAYLQTSQEIFMTSLDSGGWSSFFFFISVFVGLIHKFTAQTSSTEEVPLDSRRLSFCLSGVSRSITQ